AWPCHSRLTLGCMSLSTSRCRCRPWSFRHLRPWSFHHLRPWSTPPLSLWEPAITDITGTRIGTGEIPIATGIMGTVRGTGATPPTITAGAAGNAEEPAADDGVESTCTRARLDGVP